MIRSILLLFLMLPCIVWAQNASTKEHKLFNGAATIQLPETFIETPLGTPSETKRMAVFSNDINKQQCSIEKEAAKPEGLKADYEQTKLAYNFEYLDILRDELVTKENGRTDFYLECRLKPAFYNRNGNGGITMANGVVYPNHFIIYKTQRKGEVSTIVVKYKGAEEKLQQAREQSGSIISGYKVL